MKKIILAFSCLIVATMTMAQGETHYLAAEMLKVTPEAYAEQVKNELTPLCKLDAKQAEKVYGFALQTANKVHALAEHNRTANAPDYDAKMKATVERGESYIMNILDKNQLAAYNKKDRILRQSELIKEREAKAAALKQ
jgi:hypothetical protein